MFDNWTMKCICVFWTQHCPKIWKVEKKKSFISIAATGTWTLCYHYDDVIMGAIASLITSLTIVYSTVYSDADQRNHQSSASLAFVWGIHQGPVNSPHKWPVTRKVFPFDNVMTNSDFTEIRWWISNYISYMWDVITHPCPNYNCSFVKPPLKLGQGWVIKPLNFMWV